jgi:hypothetical protein
MATIASALSPKKTEPNDEQQLIKLFWNRAELKKELDSLRREMGKLSEQLRHREASHLRLVQQLESLESLLADPLQAANALVYYQLRGVWQLARKRLVRLGRELMERQRVREERHAHALFMAAKNESLAALDERLAPLQARAEQISADLRVAEDRLLALHGFWNFFRRKRLSHQAEAIRASLEGLAVQIDRQLAQRRDLATEKAPEFEGLSLEGRRGINIAIIAMAQQLVLHFAQHNVANLARDASIRSLADAVYGSAAECRELGLLIESVVGRLPDASDLAMGSRRRAEYLRIMAEYRRESDTVPVAGSFANIPVAISEEGELKPTVDRAISANVLADEFWDIYSVLLT